MRKPLSRREFLGLALVAGASLIGCAAPQIDTSTPAAGQDLYRATPLHPDDLDGSTLERSDEEWRALLSPLQYDVMRQKGTERAFTGEYYDHKASGAYHCSACGNPLFSSETKYASGTGWPSFWAPISEDYIETEQDKSFGMVRTEVLCARCGSHLGHVFEDGPEPTGLRYCINSVALNFDAEESGSMILPDQESSTGEMTDVTMTTSDGQVGGTLLFDFETKDALDRWVIVNDGVMGGLSQGELLLSAQGTAIFQGTLSLENYGGFASARTLPYPYALAGYEGVSLRVRGDGRRYKVRLRADQNLDGPAYETEFETTPDTWMTVMVPFRDAAPTFRGRRLRNMPPLEGQRLMQVGLMIADKQPGPFRLEVDWIRAYLPGA